ncbi:twin-arginine translocase subunit TatC [Mucilaginibacter sp. HMF5004]|uniref:twin-arginine translocase subunit TatC n=1 Tax=Mucilaginibacter rivuli TaxID=2857527 RepID=UPI001C607AB3|nr:twin-arginine translocase subunit TatC [Mucilaginibacter rivuli]MBW4888661.1 twin-arginine translocase subunit TatC [Mucilaginibacter rivuli]
MGKLLDSIRGKTKSLESEMSFFDHLEVLRWHLMRAAVAIVVFACFAFYYFDTIWQNLVMGPKHGDFLTYRLLCKLGALLGSSGMCINKDLPGELQNTELAGQFSMQINASIIIALILGFPYLLWEIWRFVKPALREKEQKATSGFVFYCSLLFGTGILFGYYVVAPLSLHFLTNYTFSAEVKNIFTIDSYLTSVATLTLVSGLVFQLPIIVFILATIGILTPTFMREKRRYAIIIIMIIAMLVTPTPDVTTMLVISAPLFLLYELSIKVAARVVKRKQLKEQDFLNA